MEGEGDGVRDTERDPNVRPEMRTTTVGHDVGAQAGAAALAPVCLQGGRKTGDGAGIGDGEPYGATVDVDLSATARNGQCPEAVGSIEAVGLERHDTRVEVLVVERQGVVRAVRDGGRQLLAEGDAAVACAVTARRHDGEGNGRPEAAAVTEHLFFALDGHLTLRSARSIGPECRKVPSSADR